MTYYIINTDLIPIDHPLFHRAWIEDGYAYTSGDPKYGNLLGRLASGDALLCYCRRVGLVAVGSVVAPWDGNSYKHPLYAGRPEQGAVYRISTDWHSDLTERPIPHSSMAACGPFSVRQTLQEIKNMETAINILSVVRNETSRTRRA